MLAAKRVSLVRCNTTWNAEEWYSPWYTVLAIGCISVWRFIYRQFRRLLRIDLRRKYW
jgi:hypothetical protein